MITYHLWSLLWHNLFLRKTVRKFGSIFPSKRLLFKPNSKSNVCLWFWYIAAGKEKILCVSRFHFLYLKRGQHWFFTPGARQPLLEYPNRATTFRSMTLSTKLCYMWTSFPVHLYKKTASSATLRRQCIQGAIIIYTYSYSVLVMYALIVFC